MAPMKRERQWDMFDVAIGACELDDYLNQRYQESDLQSKFWVEKQDRVDELRPPAPGTKEQVLIPVQGPGVTPPPPPQPVSSEPLPARPPWEAPAAEAPLPSRPPWETSPPSEPQATPIPPVAQAPPPPRPAVEPSVAPPAYRAPEPPAESVPPEVAPEPQAAAPAAVMPPNMAELLARFHQAAQDYEERSRGALGEPTADSTEQDETDQQ